MICGLAHTFATQPMGHDGVATGTVLRANYPGEGCQPHAAELARSTGRTTPHALDTDRRGPTTAANSASMNTATPFPTPSPGCVGVAHSSIARAPLAIEHRSMNDNTPWEAWGQRDVA